MPTLTVKIASRGTVYNINEKSAVGHMWMSIDSDGFDGTTPALSMGFAPEKIKGSASLISYS